MIWELSYNQVIRKENRKMTIDPIEVELLENELTTYSIYKTFAMNIQIGQLKAVIPQYEWNDKRFQEERDYFLWWLTQPDKGGRYNFLDQVSAWSAYERIHEPIEFDEEEEFTPSWLEEIENAINSAVRAGNYSGYGGQL